MKWLKYFVFFILFLLVLFSIDDVSANKLVNASNTSKSKSLPCDDTKTQKVRVAIGRLTILSFPVKPKEILPGESSFDFKQIKNDLAIKSLKVNGKTNVFVYLAERRCAFDVITVPVGGDDIIFIKDPEENQFKVDFK